MIKWLMQCFPSLPKELTTKVVLDLPEWSLADCNQLDAFLQSSTGKKLMRRLRHTATAMCLDPKHADVALSSDRRALAFIIEGIDSLADDEFWKQQSIQYLEEEFMGVSEDDYLDEDLEA